MKHSKLAALTATPLLLMSLAACGSDDSSGGSGDNATGSGKLVTELDRTKIYELDARPVLDTVADTGGASGDECSLEGPDLFDGEHDQLTVELTQSPDTIEALLRIYAEKDEVDSYEVDTDPEANREKYLGAGFADASTDGITGIIYPNRPGVDDDAMREPDGFTVKADGWTYALEFTDENLSFYFVQEDGNSLRCNYDHNGKGHGKAHSQPQEDGLLFWEQAKQAEALAWCNQALAASRD